MGRITGDTATRAVRPPRALQDLVAAALVRWRDGDGQRRSLDRAAELLLDAIESSSVQVAFQPIIELATRRPVAVEALVRLDGCKCPELADAATAVRIAERTGLIAALGTEVLVRACSQLAAWRRDPRHHDLQVHVNVSPHQLRDDRFVDVVARTLHATGLPPRAVVLEVTESAAFEGDGFAEVTLTRLTSLGVEVAIDDFGTGFASLELLASTPARSIKLDRSFVAAVGSETDPPRGRAMMVRAAIDLGHALGLRVVAEGVESERQARTLSAWGCTYGQGYHFAQPATADALDLTHGDVLPSPGTPIHTSSLPRMSPAAAELALGIAAVLTSGTPETASMRADAMAIAVLLGDVPGFERRAVDLSAVLACIVDPPTRLRELLPAGSDNPLVDEVATALGARPTLRPEAPVGSLAAFARRLGIARSDGRSLEHALASLDPTLDPARFRRLAAWWEDPTPSPPALAELGALERRLRDRDEAGRRLRSLTSLTEAICRGGALEDVLEVAAEEARIALGASSLSISRLERDKGLLRTLINTGELALWEQHRPTDEVYELSAYPLASERLLDSAVNIETVDSPSGDRSERDLLGELGKGSSIGAPIVVGGTTWGELYATTARNAPPFTMADSPFVTAITNVIALAIERTEQVEQLTRLAGEDPLTRLANRRQLEQRVRSFLDREQPGTLLGLLMLDVDGLKDVNDEFGHGEGDALLVRVADVLSRTALTLPGALAARLAGDEFCLVMPGDGVNIESVVERLRGRLADGPPPQPRLSAGFALARVGQADLSELLRRADAAQYRAKRTGAALVVLQPDDDLPEAGPGMPDFAPAPRRRRASEVGDGGGATATALTRWRRMLKGGSTVQCLEALGDALVVMLDLNRWLLSEVPPGSANLHIRSIHARRRNPGVTPFPPLDEQVYALADYPATAQAMRDGSGFHLDVDDLGADPAERELLAELGNRYLVAFGEREDDGRAWLLELYGDDHSRPLADAVPLIEALTSRTLGRPVRCVRTARS